MIFNVKIAGECPAATIVLLTENSQEKTGLSAVAYDRNLKVSRTIADISPYTPIKA
jgi:predicted ATPase with chaperone activity